MILRIFSILGGISCFFAGFTRKKTHDAPLYGEVTILLFIDGDGTLKFQAIQKMNPDEGDKRKGHFPPQVKTVRQRKDYSKKTLDELTPNR